MENYYKRDNESYLQYSSEQSDESELNMLVLDLSCKKRVVSTSSEDGIIQATTSSQTLPVNRRKQKYHEVNFLDENTQTPVAGSSAMLSPYSESNSPKEKPDSVDCYENSDELKHTMSPTNMPSIIPGVTMVTSQQSSILALPNEAIPVIPKISIPYMETSQSFTTDSEARKNISVLSAERPTSSDIKSPIPLLDTTKKTPRPFKAYPNNLLSVIRTSDDSSSEGYVQYREMILERINKMNRNTGNPKMRRVSKCASNPGLPTSTVDEKDAAYWERRRKNNEAAKRSRDARRAKEDELAIRTSFLEQENEYLKRELQRVQEILIYHNCYFR